MIWPTLCVDNFFINPYEIKKYALSLDYNHPKEGHYPGKRTEALHKINSDFHTLITTKILKLLYPMNTDDLTWAAKSYFQKIDGNIYSQSGWVHQDPDEFTVLIYLSHHKNCGTSIFSSKDINSKIINNQSRVEVHLKASLENKKIGEDSKELISNNSQFEKTITFNSKFNRLILFDSSHYHAAEKFNEIGINEDRLTLIIFFESIFSPSGKQIKFPIPEMNRINNL
jgi:hypothetical protein